MKKNLLLNTTLMLLFQALTALSGFILPAMYISAYGSAINGTIATVSQITGFLCLLESGMGAVASVAFYRSLSGNEGYNLTVVRNTIKKFYRMVGGVSLGLSAVIAAVLPLFLKNGSTFRFNMELVAILSMGYFVNYYFGITNQLMLAAEYKRYVISLAQIASLILQFIAAVLMIKAEADIRLLKLVSALIAFIRPVALNVYVRRKYAFENGNRSIDYNLMKQRWNNFGQSVAFYIHTRTDMIVIMMFLEVTQNSIYSRYVAIVEAVKMLVTTVNKNYEPIIGRACSEKGVGSAHVKSTFERFIITNGLLVNTLFPVAAVLVIPFMRIYTSGFDIDYIKPALGYCLLLSEYIYLIRVPYNSLVNANNLFKETQNSAFIEAGMNVVMSIAFVFYFGVTGVAAATAIAMLFRFVYYYLYVKKHLIQMSLRDTMRPAICFLVSLACAVGAIVFLDFTWITSYKRFIEAGCVYMLAFTAIQLFVNALIYDSFREGLVKRLKRLLGKAA